MRDIADTRSSAGCETEPHADTCPTLRPRGEGAPVGVSPYSGHFGAEASAGPSFSGHLPERSDQVVERGPWVAEVFRAASGRALAGRIRRAPSAGAGWAGA